MDIGRALKRRISGALDVLLDRQTHNPNAPDVAGLWLLHPEGRYLLERGGRDVAPPATANLALTNKCNLRCEICGSQKHLDNSGARRRHTDFDQLEKVANTLFPVLLTVELNSQGDPLLYPNIERVLELIRDHKCELKVQTNGTLFTDRVVDLLASMYGQVNLSIDAVGPKFDEVRRGGVWAKAEPGIRKLLERRDPEMLSVGLYPTVTRRTIDEGVNIVAWATELGIESVIFHRYSPLADGWSTEEAPTAEEYAQAREAVRRWCEWTKSPIDVWFESEQLNPRFAPPRKAKMASPEKQAFVYSYNSPNYPRDPKAPGADRRYVCTAPNAYVEVGLDGQLSACCRSQEVPLGYATSAKEFADTWFGPNYTRIRQSLRRRRHDRYPLPNCEECVRFFAPNSIGKRKAVPYVGQSTVQKDGLTLAVKGDIVLDQLAHYRDQVFSAIHIPPGLDIDDFDVFEAETPLRRVASEEEVDLGPPGAFFMVGRHILMSSTDGKDPRFARRQYMLRRKAKAAAE